jgi:diacylglycerol kinase (ATP)
VQSAGQLLVFAEGANLEPDRAEGQLLRVSLFHNARAGDGAAPDEILAILANHGHEVVRVVETEPEAAELLEQACDLVVAAGGDGTVAIVARAIAGRGVPMAILPRGTANNIALTLGIEAPIDDLIEGWNTARSRAVDLGVARGPWGKRVFVESVGVGLVPAGIASTMSRPFAEIDRCLSNLVRTATLYRDALTHLQPHQCTIDADGRRFTGGFLLIEVHNIPFVGPNLVFAPAANPSDGFLSLTFAWEEQRQQLDEYLRHRIEGTDCPVSLASYRGRCIQMDDPGCLHLDDEVYQTAPGTQVSLEIDAGALNVLL